MPARRIRRAPWLWRWLPLAALMLGFGLCGHAATGLPDLENARELWRGSFENARFRLVQVPDRGLVYVPIRLFLVGDEPNMARTDAALRAVDSVVIEAADGNPETLLGYGQREIKPIRLGPDLVEIQETFRMSGEYSVTLDFDDASKEALTLPLRLEVAPYRLAPFHLEFPIFVVGCLILGSILYGIYRRLEYLSSRRDDLGPVVAD